MAFIDCLLLAISPFLIIFLPYMVLIFHFKYTLKFRLQFVSIWTNLKVPIAAIRMIFVYKIQVNPIHGILKYGIYYDFMDR